MNQGLPCAAASGLQRNINHYENFPVASVLCPARFRPAITAIYGFARTADDLADEGNALPAQRLQDLAAYRADLMACIQGQAFSTRWAAVFKVLAPAIHQWELPIKLLTDLISAFEQDVIKPRYANQAELLDYCTRSANPVGRLLLHLYGIQDENLLQMSDSICTALQLINFWQDLSVDIPRGRIYLPADAQQRHGVDETHLLRLESNPNTINLIAENVHFARATMLKGSPLVKKLPGRCGWELRLVVQGGLRILDKIEALNFTTLQHRPTLKAWDVTVMGWRAMLM